MNTDKEIKEAKRYLLDEVMHLRLRWYEGELPKWLRWSKVKGKYFIYLNKLKKSDL